MSSSLMAGRSAASLAASASSVAKFVKAPESLSRRAARYGCYKVVRCTPTPIEGGRMTPDAEAPKPRLTGEAAWKAQLNATEQRNAAATRAAHERKSPTELAIIQRERRLALVEAEQLKALNARIAKRG